MPLSSKNKYFRKFICDRCQNVWETDGWTLVKFDPYTFTDTLSTYCPRCLKENFLTLPATPLIKNVPGWLMPLIKLIFSSTVYPKIIKSIPWLKPILDYFLLEKGGETAVANTFWESIVPIVLGALLGTDAYKNAIQEIADAAEGKIPDVLEPYVGQILQDLGKAIAE